MSVRKGDDIISGTYSNKYLPDLFDFKWADHKLNNPSWLRADTFSWQNAVAYQAAYQHLLDDWNEVGDNPETEIIEGIQIWYRLAPDGHKICSASQESNVTAIYNTTGVAWYYIIDTTNQRFKLPRTKFGFAGIRSNIGGYIEAGLPNIMAIWSSDNRDGNSYHESATGAVTQSTKSNWSFAGGSAYSTSYKNTFDASSSNSIYGNSDTVQPKATEMYLYFYMGPFTQTALENTAGVTTEVLNSKLDLDLENITSSTKEKIVNWSLPDYTAGISVSSYPYTAQFDCFYFGVFSRTRDNTISMTINGNTTQLWSGQSTYNSYDGIIQIYLNKGDVLTFNYNPARATVYKLKG